MKTFIIIAGVFCALIAYLVIHERANSNAPIYEKDLNKLTKQFLVEAKEKYDIVGTSFGGTLQDKIRVILLNVSSKKDDCTIEEARELLVNCVEEYLIQINANEKIRPHLSHYPFSEEGIKFGIGFNSKGDHSIRMIYCSNGNVYYSSKIEGQVAFEKRYEETYEEARAKVMAERERRAAIGD